MRFWKQYGDYALVLVICLLAAWPFLAYASLPTQTDAELHIYRLAELSRLVRGGLLYPRWSPNFYFGYGYPIFNYYAPLSYYVGLLFDFLPVVQPVGAVKAVFVLGLGLAAVGTFGTVRDLWGRPAGWVAAAVYVYAPYVQYVDPHARGVLAESFSLGVWAMALWAFTRLRRQPTAANWLAAVVGMAAIVLTHNLMAMVLAGVLMGWVVWSAVVGRAPYWPVLLAAYGVGIGLAAFFWLPVGLERNAINVATVVGEVGSHFDFRRHFLTLGELLAPSAWLDWGASDPAYRFNLGVAQWALGGLGMGFAVWRTARRQWSHAAEPLFFTLAALLLVALMLPFSTAMWEAIPLLPYIQFPWRLLGPAVSLLAILAGYAMHELGQMGRYGWAAVPTALAFTLLLALPLTQVAPWPADFGETTVARIAYLETRGRWLGTTSTSDFVPATVDTVSEQNGQLLEGLFNNRTPDRINYWSVDSVGATATWSEISPLHWRYQITSPQEFTFRLFLFAFPGWQARVDGQPVPTDIAHPEGFLVVPMPAGEHVLDIEFGDTPPRTAGWIIAAVSLLLAGGGALGWRGRVFPADLPLATADWRPVLAVTAVVWLLFAPLHATGWLHYNSTAEVAVAANPLQVDIGGQIYLQGADWPTRPLAAGDTLPLILYWRAQQPLDINYQAFVHLLAADGRLVAQGDKLNPGEFPTRRWPLDKYVRDTYTIPLPADLPPGRYQLAVGLWVAAEGWRLPVLNANGEQSGDSYPLVEIVVHGN